MEKQDLVILLDELLKPINYKRKNNYWVNNHGDIAKIVNLQKSNFGNLFYINYGYIIKKLPLGLGKDHVGNRLHSKKAPENRRIHELLDLENGIDDELRTIELRSIIQSNLINEMELVCTEQDLLCNIKNRQTTIDIPALVKEYFNL